MAATAPEPVSLAEEARVMVELTTAAQGLPFHVEDPVVLRRIVQLTKPRND